MRLHDCDVEYCGICEQAIADIEYEREFGHEDVPQFYDGT